MNDELPTFVLLSDYVFGTCTGLEMPLILLSVNLRLFDCNKSE
jgi:hypothetical protein